MMLIEIFFPFNCSNDAFQKLTACVCILIVKTNFEPRVLQKFVSLRGSQFCKPRIMTTIWCLQSVKDLCASYFKSTTHPSAFEYRYGCDMFFFFLIIIYFIYFFQLAYSKNRELQRYPRRERERERQRQRENVKVFGASYLEACISFNMCTRMLIFGMEVPLGYTIDVVKLK